MSMNKDLNKDIIVDSLLRGYGRLFDLDCTMEDPLFDEVIENIKKPSSEIIAGYWTSVGGYISNSIDREYARTNSAKKNIELSNTIK